MERSRVEEEPFAPPVEREESLRFMRDGRLLAGWMEVAKSCRARLSIQLYSYVQEGRSEVGQSCPPRRGGSGTATYLLLALAILLQ